MAKGENAFEKEFGYRFADGRFFDKAEALHKIRLDAITKLPDGNEEVAAFIATHAEEISRILAETAKAVD